MLPRMGSSRFWFVCIFPLLCFLSTLPFALAQPPPAPKTPAPKTLTLQTPTLQNGIEQYKKENYEEAIESFEKSMALNAKLTQSAEFQIALCHLQNRELKKAREQFQAAVLHGPNTDLATFARRYQDMVDKRIFEERPWRFTLGTEESSIPGMCWRSSWATTTRSITRPRPVPRRTETGTESGPT